MAWYGIVLSIQGVRDEQGDIQVVQEPTDRGKTDDQKKMKGQTLFSPVQLGIIIQRS